VDELLSRIGIPDDERNEFVSLFSRKKLASGDVLFEYNGVAEELFFLLVGNLAVHKFTGFLEKMQVIALLDSGAGVGAAALLTGHLRAPRVTASSAPTLLCLRKDDFEMFRKKFPDSGLRFLEYLFSMVSLRLEKTSERLARIL
jgi:signal-transduction protein with cAMP-binding, CBS, and nucleotidyltransferase domain